MFSIPSPASISRNCLQGKKRKASEIEDVISVGQAKIPGYFTDHPKGNVSQQLQSILHKKHSVRCQETIDSLDGEIKGCLEALFWKHFNSYMPLVLEAHLAAQNRDYSSFLHLAVLATGLRFVGTGRERITVSKSTKNNLSLHQDLRAAFDGQLFTPRSLHDAQALVLLADLEYGSGRYCSAFSYLQQAQEIVITKSMLHDTAVADEDVILYRMVSRACEYFWLQ